MRLWPKHDPAWSRATAADLAALQAWSELTAPTPAGGPYRRLRRCHVTPRPPAMTAATTGVPPQGRLLFFSDLHWDTRDAAAATAFVAAINAAAPDWLVFGGDLMTYMYFAPAAMDILGRLQARHGKFAVPGNWELRRNWYPITQWRAQFAQAGFRLLVNEVAECAGLVLCGYDDLRWGAPDLRIAAPLATRWPVIGVAHEPHTFAESGTAFAGHLLLSGHTHAGQLRLPAFGALHTSTPYWKQFEHGWYRRRTDGTLLHVSAGLGCTGWEPLRHRFFCPPELLVLTLASAP